MAARAAVATSPEPCFPDQEAASNLIGELYEAHGRMVVGLCRFLLRDPVEADDAAQQSFMAAHRSLLGGAAPRDAPAWLATIARNECRARIKQRMREPLPLLEPDGIEGQLPDPFHEAAKNADLRALRDGLEALPDTQRNAFVLREFAGLSYEELAAALGVTEPAVESLLVRARTKLRLALVRANPLVVPLVIRDQLARLATGFDDGSAGAVAKLVSLPLAAKLAAAGAGIALVAGGGSLSGEQSGGDRLAPSPAGVAIAPADERGAAASAGRGSSRFSAPVMVATTVHREDAADSRLGSGTSDDSAVGSDSDRHGRGPSSSGSGPASAVGEDGSAPSGNPLRGDDSSPSGGTPGGDGGSEDTSSEATSARSGAGSEGGQPSSSAEDDAASTTSESSSKSTESEVDRSTGESGSGETHELQRSSDGSPSAEDSTPPGG